MLLSSLSTLCLCLGLAHHVAATPSRGRNRGASRCRAGGQAAQAAAYLITNEDANSVVSLSIDANGMLSGGSSFETGGAGSVSIDGSTNSPALSDPLVSQSALTVAGRVSGKPSCRRDARLTNVEPQNLFAANAGSNTVTMFSIDRNDPTKLTMVGQPVDVPGEFPNTVAASAKNGIVCVGTSGAVAGVSCAPFTSGGGIGTMDALRPFDLGQTTPPVGPTNTVSQVFFSEDENTLFTTVKGDPPQNKTGFLAAFPVEASSSCGAAGAAAVSADGTQSSPAGTAVLFGSSIIPGSTDLFVTDASFGAAVLSLDAADAAEVKGQGNIGDQIATCWAAVSPATNTAFVTDVAVNRLVEMSLDDATILSEIDLSANGQPGMIDLKASGNLVYALSPGNGTTEPAVAVVDATSRQQVQFFGLGALGVSNRVQGLAVSQ